MRYCGPTDSRFARPAASRTLPKGAPGRARIITVRTAVVEPPTNSPSDDIANGRDWGLRSPHDRLGEASETGSACIAAKAKRTGRSPTRLLHRWREGFPRWSRTILHRRSRLLGARVSGYRRPARHFSVISTSASPLSNLARIHARGEVDFAGRPSGTSRPSRDS